MARSGRRGWDFVKVGKKYQYKEEDFIAIVKVLEDNSDEEAYRFKLKVLAATYSFDPIFDIMHSKNFDGLYNGMMQFYEVFEYACTYTYGESQNFYNNNIIADLGGNIDEWKSSEKD